MLEPKDALVRLRDGNKRFVNGEAWANERSGHEYRSQLLNEQRPFAIILGCSDSRVPAELVFDQGLGCLLYTSPSPRDQRGSRMPSSA